MASGEMEDDGVGALGAAKMEKRPLREHKESRNGGSSGGPGGTRSGGLTNPNSSPRIAGPDSMSANGLRKVAKGKVTEMSTGGHRRPDQTCCWSQKGNEMG